MKKRKKKNHKRPEQGLRANLLHALLDTLTSVCVCVRVSQSGKLRQIVVFDVQRYPLAGDARYKRVIL